MPTQRCHVEEHAAYADLLAVELALMTEAVAEADLAATVPACPDWTVRDLVEHTGGVHRWAAHMVTNRSPKVVRRAELDLALPATDGDWAGWLASGGELLLDALYAADPEAEMWAWGEDQRARFWSRRMLHETLVHRMDAEAVRRVAQPVTTEVGVDGVDEFLDNLPRAAVFAPSVSRLTGIGRLALHAPDAGVSWLVTLRPDGFDWSHDREEADAQVSASASDLLRFVWGRPADVERSGDPALLELWSECTAI